MPDKFIINKSYNKSRFDKWFKEEVINLPNSLIQKLLRKNQIKVDDDGYLSIGLKFMTLEYTGDMTRDELHRALRAKNLDDEFVAYEDTLYVRPGYNEPGTSYIVGRDD